MLEVILSPTFRNKLLDSNGKGWIYSWFCLDHVGFSGYNPRRRDAGYHNIYDHYNNHPLTTNDHISFHFHPVPFCGDYHASSTRFWNSNITEILARKVIDRGFFPSTFRPGFHAERPDSHFFLEQWIPFDYANQSVKGAESNQPDCGNGRFGDWRRATTEWEIYHPHHDDYQIKGNCRRYIARCLNMYARLRSISQDDVDCAFERALQRDEKVLLAFDTHDYRDMAFEVDLVRGMIEKSAKKYAVPFFYSRADVAMRECLNLEKKPLDLQITLDSAKAELSVRVNDELFGPQPFLAFKSTSGVYYHDNFDFFAKNHFTYTFDRNTLPLKAIESIGIAGNTKAGLTEVALLDVLSNSIKKRTLNNA